MDAYRTINDTLVNLFNEIWELEKYVFLKRRSMLCIILLLKIYFSLFCIFILLVIKQLYKKSDGF